MDFTVPFSIPFLVERLETWDAEERTLIDAGDPQGDGAFYQRERIAAGARWAVSKFAGDLVEIGVLHGSTTVRLAEVARIAKRRVIAIDPFEVGTQNVEPETYGIFCQTIEPYVDVIDFMRMRSDDERVTAELRERKLAFAFVDGLHEWDAALYDLIAVSHAGLIVLDDTRWSKDVSGALTEFGGVGMQRFFRKVISHSYWRESWIV